MRTLGRDNLEGKLPLWTWKDLSKTHLLLREEGLTCMDLGSHVDNSNFYSKQRSKQIESRSNKQSESTNTLTHIFFLHERSDHSRRNLSKLYQNIL